MFRRIIIIASAVLILAAFVVFVIVKSFGGHDGVSSAQDKPAQVNTSASKPSATQTETHIASGALQDMPLAMAIVDAEREIANGADAKTVLEALRQKLLAADRKSAGAAICAYLASKRDVATGMSFVVGPNGEILSTTSMRGYLLDMLLMVDPQAALAEAEAVFDAKASADEYAICLRNVGKIDTTDTGRAYVAQRARELLTSGLATNPTAGFVESFDAIVYGGNSSDIKLLAGYINKDKGIGLNMPAFMALDRMVIDEPVDAMQTLLDNPTLLDERPLTRAGFFARADLSDDAQLAEVEQYVQSLNPSSEEAQYYFSLFPNVNFTLTDGILTVRLSVSAEYVQTRFDAAIETVNTWLSDSRYANYKTELEAAKTRLKAQLGK